MSLHSLWPLAGGNPYDLSAAVRTSARSVPNLILSRRDLSGRCGSQVNGQAVPTSLKGDV
jgi:hypothetical protein